MCTANASCARAVAAKCVEYHQTADLLGRMLQDFLLTDFNVDFHDEASLGRLQGGCTLHAIFGANKKALLPTKVTQASPPCMCTYKQYCYMCSTACCLNRWQLQAAAGPCIVLASAGAY